MKKKIICFLTALLLVISAANLPAYAASSPAQENFYRQLAELVSKQDNSKFFHEMELRIGSDILTVDGETQILTAAPEITNARTMLPIRAVAEAAGAEVDWDPATSTVLIESASGDTIRCSIGSQNITVNDQTSRMDVTPYIKNDRTYLPVRAVTEALELEVEWEGGTQTVRLTAPYQTARLIVLANTLDTRALDAETVLSNGDGMWILQFDTPTQAKKAAEALERQGIMADPDLFVSPIRDNTAADSAAAGGTHYSWGAEDSGFDGYISKYSGLFKSNGVVAVIDTGVDSTHSLLKGRVLSGGYDFVDGDSNPSDGHYHGTHVAGTIIDCVGSAPVNILPIRVLDTQGSGYSSIIVLGIRYAAEHSADVLNLSLGGIGCSSAMDSAISYVIGKGCLVVASAGNDSINTSGVCPAHITTGGAVIVSAGDSGHNKASFSNYGTSVDLMAPGVSIRSSIPGNGYGTLSGTSMAAPHAAAAAMLIDLAWGKALAPASLERELYSATTYGKWTDSSVGYGFLDLSKANAPSGSITPAISLDRSILSLKAGESQTLTATVTPAGTAVSWSSNNTAVATVSGGKVTAAGQGTATITAQIVYNGATYQAKCAVTVSGGEPSEWTTVKLPEKDGYTVETKVQYRFRNKETTQASQSSLAGWTLYDTKTETTWGSWSDWKNGSITNVGSDTQVETRQTAGSTTRYYDLYYYKYWNTTYDDWYYTYSASFATARGGTKYTATAQASLCTPSQSYDGQQAYRYNGFDLWWIENVRDVTAQVQQYRMRTKTETKTYYYYKWSDWSEWKDVAVTAEDNVEVETRLLYRYVPVK